MGNFTSNPEYSISNQPIESLEEAFSEPSRKRSKLTLLPLNSISSNLEPIAQRPLVKNSVLESSNKEVIHKQVTISENQKGISFESIFSLCIDDNLSIVIMEDPYICHMHQIYNFISFCEVLVKKARYLRAIELITRQSNDNEQLLRILRDNLMREKNITLRIFFKDFHDRRIYFNNGWKILIGRGLDIFKKSESFSLGIYDFSYRACKNTRIDYIKVQTE